MALVPCGAGSARGEAFFALCRHVHSTGYLPGDVNAFGREERAGTRGAAAADMQRLRRTAGALRLALALTHTPLIQSGGGGS
jgi:hypothetical protein